MTHDQHERRRLHQLAQGVGHDAGFDLCAFFDLFRRAAEKFEGKAALDHRLVAAARKGHIGGEVGKLVLLLQRLAVAADADGKCHRDIFAVFDLPHAGQHTELVVNKFFQRLLLTQENIPVAVVFADHDALVLQPFVDLRIDLRLDAGLVGIGQIFKHFLIAVDADDAHDRTRALILGAQLLIISRVHPEQRDEKAPAARVFIFRTDKIAVYRVRPFPDCNVIRAQALPFHDPARVEPWHNVGNMHLKNMLVRTGDGEEVVIAPDDIARLHVDDNHRQRKVDDRILRRSIDVQGQALDVFHDLPPADTERPAVEKVHRQHDQQFEHRRLPRVKEAQAREHEQRKKLQPDARLHQTEQLFVHIAILLSRPARRHADSVRTGAARTCHKIYFILYQFSVLKTRAE